MAKRVGKGRFRAQERVVRSFEKCEYASGQVVVKQGEEAPPNS